MKLTENVKWILMVMLGIILIGALGSVLMSNQITANQERYCETYDDTTTYNVSNNICYEATNESNQNDPVTNEAFNLFTVILGIGVLFAVVMAIIGWFKLH